ncbi:hypothetical protein [Thermococcus waiotapuensis]|uniref:Uncharacterized protein n=1 Tax=Thermococcus waiotapuensis TaxID=90909 RepID=A0AAE4NTV8_9EURY|nr:hypothetical protein [Thermococcus waiotapuensis]MDV3103271.1 hypothetical protein [Thermococcus waiotapuensis]
MKKLLALLGVLLLVPTIVTPAVGATNVSTKLSDYVVISQNTSWSGANYYTLFRTLSTTAGGTVVNVSVTVDWDGLAVAELFVMAHSRDIKTNTGDTEHFIEAIGSAFFGEGSYHAFSDPTGYGYEKFWVTPSRMVFYGGHGTTQISRTYTISVYAQSEEEAKAEIKAGFDELGIEASVSAITSVKVGEKVEYTVTVTATVYQHYWDTEYVGSLNFLYHITNPNPGPIALSKQVGVSGTTSYDMYREKPFDFQEMGYIYSYEDVDMETQGITGEMVS